MLVLSRRVRESIIIDNGTIKITVLGFHGNEVRIGIIAPRTMSVHREEIQERIDQEGATPGERKAS